jgi:Lar family restriction alleviation protein
MKECPFCGSKDVKQSERVHYGHGDCTCEVFVLCNNCKARGGDTGYWGQPTDQQRNEAIVMWNTRQPSPEIP